VADRIVVTERVEVSRPTASPASAYAASRVEAEAGVSRRADSQDSRHV
jgi:hypothetical protein